MPLSASVDISRAEKDDEQRATSTERQNNSSDMEIDDEEEEEVGGHLQGSLNRKDASDVLDGYLGSDSTTPGKAEMRLLSQFLAVGESGANSKFSSLSNEPLATQRDDICKKSAAAQTSAGNLSPGDELNSGNKRPALICDFFARGWCIKGSSCRFRHIKDGENISIKQSEEDAATTDEKRAAQLYEGFRNAAERSRPPGSTDTLPSTDGNMTILSSHLFSERILPLEHIDNYRSHPVYEINMFSKDKSLRSSPGSLKFSALTDELGPSKDVKQNVIGHKLLADNYAKPAILSDRGISTFKSSLPPEFRSSLSGSVTSSGNMHGDNQVFHVSTLIGPLPFGSSLRQSSSLFSRSEPENFPLNNIPRDPLPSADYRLKFSPDDWEPSVPFRPSFFVTSSILSPQSQYDPIRDSIDLSNARLQSLKFSFSSQGPSLLNVTCAPIYGDSTSTGPRGLECNGDNGTASCRKRCHENLVNSNTSGKDSLTTDANDGTSAADMQNGRLAKEEMSSVVSHVKDISKAKKVVADLDGRHQTDASRSKNDLKVVRVREKDEIDVEHKADGGVWKESKAMRHFHTALIDLVKALLKPTWHEGHLSKDAHNLIVKKAVDKILGTIPPHQIPSTFDSVKLYLSSSQPKIAKLVEGYVDKYGKS